MYSHVQLKIVLLAVNNQHISNTVRSKMKLSLFPLICLHTSPWWYKTYKYKQHSIK